MTIDIDRITKHMERARAELRAVCPNPDIKLQLAIVLCDLDDLLKERKEKCG